MHTLCTGSPVHCINREVTKIKKMYIRAFNIFIIVVLAHCYVVAKVYTRYCICDTVPSCRAHVHMFTIIQFLRARANILEALQHVNCIQGNNGLENSH